MTTIDIMPELRDKAADDSTFEELRGKTPDELLRYVEVLEAHLRSIHQDENTSELRDKTEAEQIAFDYGLKLRDAAIAKIEEHRAVQEVFRRRPKSVEAALQNIGSRNREDPYGDIRRMSTNEARDRAHRILDTDRTSTAHMSTAQKDEVDRQIRRDPDIARRILVTENEHYRNAWMKLVTQPDAGLYLTEEERHAVRTFNEYRAMGEVTTTAGGFGIPVMAAA